MYMAAHELDVGDFGPAAFGTIGGEVFVVEGVAGGAREVGGEYSRGWRWGMDGGLEGVDGLLLEDVAGEEEEGSECEDCVRLVRGDHLGGRGDRHREKGGKRGGEAYRYWKRWQ